MSGHLLNLDSNYIHVIWVEQLLQETQTFTRGFLCMLVREELKLFSTSVRTSPFPSLKTLVSGHLLDLVCIDFWLPAVDSNKIEENYGASQIFEVQDRISQVGTTTAKTFLGLIIITIGASLWYNF